MEPHEDGHIKLTCIFCAKWFAVKEITKIKTLPSCNECRILTGEKVHSICYNKDCRKVHYKSVNHLGSQSYCFLHFSSITMDE